MVGWESRGYLLFHHYPLTHYSNTTPLFLQRRADAELAGEAPAAVDFNYAYPDEGVYDYGNAATAEQPLLGYDSDPNNNNGYNDWQASGQEAAAAPVQELGGWETAYDEEGTPYYYNINTGISTYDSPYTPLDPEVGSG